MKMRTVLIVLLLAALVAFIAYQGKMALHASRPNDMPPSARFVQTGFDMASNQPLGQWVACRSSLDQPTSWCRVTDQQGLVVFEGQFLPIDSTIPVSVDKLKVAALDKERLWTSGPFEQAPVPVIPLQDGQILVPASDREALIARWAQNPDDSQKYLQAPN